MSEKQETVADIVAEMRGFKCRNLETGEIEECSFIANYLSDRIEAAQKREVEAITAKLEEARHCWKVWSERADELRNKCDEQYAQLKSVGNADIGNGAKMREALELCVKQMSDAICDKDFGDDVVYLVGCMKTCIDYMKATLAISPRNCDVYNSETCRMAYHMKGLGLMTMQAFADWLFAPYESEVTK